MPSLRRLFALSLLTLPLLAAAAWAGVPAGLIGPAPSDFAFVRLVARNPHVQALARLAEEHGVTWGIYGGTVRDLYLKQPFSPISDVDMIYDSSEKAFPAFRDAVWSYHGQHRSEMPTPDFHWDTAPRKPGSARQHSYHEIGITATKIGLMRDGGLVDPTKLGLQDLRDRVFRYYPPEKKLIQLENLGRFVRDMVRLPRFRRDPRTVKLMRGSMARWGDPRSEEGRKARKAAAALIARKEGLLVDFPGLINPFRRDLRHLHNGEEERIGPCFPADLFLFDLLKCVTQASSVKDLREVFAFLGVDRLLEKLGLEAEAKILMDDGLDRAALFARFAFPGHQPDPSSIEGLAFHRGWRKILRRYAYRSLWDMLASEFPGGSPEQALLKKKGAAFMTRGTYALLNPDEVWDDQILGYLDVEFNEGRLPKERLRKSLDWFLRTYFPYGPGLLLPLEGKAARPGPALLRNLKRSWSPEVLAIDRKAPHGFTDLESYLAFQIGAELLPLYRDERTELAFFRCDEGDARTLVKALGYDEIRRLNAPGFNRRKRSFLAWRKKDDRVLIAHCAFHSDEQLLNHQARAYLALGATGRSPRRDHVWVLRRPAEGFPACAEVKDFLEKLDAPVVAFFVNFTNPLKQRLKKVEKVEIRDLQFLVGELPAPPRRLVLAMSGFGACYGSIPAAVLRLLDPKPLEGVAMVGTGGGIQGVKRRFQWVLPDRVFLADRLPLRRPLNFRNAAEELGLEGCLSRALHGTVLSPMVETRSWVRQMRRAHVHTVDCELYHLVAAAAEHAPEAEFYGLVNVTDFPLGNEGEAGKDGSIGGERDGKQYRMVDEALGRIVDRLSRP